MFSALARVWANPYARLVLTVIGLGLGYFFIRFTLRIWVIVSLAYLLAYLGHPVVSVLEWRRVPRPLGILLGLLLFLGLASVLHRHRHGRGLFRAGGGAHRHSRDGVSQAALR